MTNLENLRSQVLELTLNYGSESIKNVEPFIPGDSAVPVSGKVLDSADFVNLVDASLDGWLTSGRFHKTFEQALAQFVGVRN